MRKPTFLAREYGSLLPRFALRMVHANSAGATKLPRNTRQTLFDTDWSSRPSAPL